MKWHEFGPFSISGEDGGRIVGVKENEYFSFEWQPGESITQVSFRLKSFQTGTLVTVEETGYSMSEQDLTACLDCAAGWGEALTLLKFHLEHGVTY